MQHLFLGISADGGWCMFRDFNMLPKEHLQLMQYSLAVIHNCLKNKSQQMEIEGFSPVRFNLLFHISFEESDKGDKGDVKQHNSIIFIITTSGNYEYYAIIFGY